MFSSSWLQFIPNITINNSSTTSIPTTIKVIQFNVDHGGESRKSAILSWLQQQNANIVGFCEANKWQNNLTNLSKAAGYKYAEIFPTRHGFPLAVFSKTPIEVLGKYDTYFERGVLHVRILGVQFFIAHLNAHNSTARSIETKHLATLLPPPPAKVVVMGDMNTLSPLDDQSLQNMTVEELPLLEALSSRYCYKAMRQKFLENNLFAYQPMHNLLEAGLIDASTMRQPTEPTDIPCDQVRFCKCPSLRLDYMLVSKHLAILKPDLLNAKVIRTKKTNQLSDHFPLELQFPLQLY